MDNGNLTTITCEIGSESDTVRLGRAAAVACRSCDGLLVALQGTLGAGKTRLVQSMAEAWGYDRRDIVSPTFTICIEHRGPVPFQHVDAYRLDGAEQWNELGIDEMLDDGQLVVVEWADRVARVLPPDRLTIAVEILAAEGRRMVLSSGGPVSERVLLEIAESLPGLIGE